MPGVGGGHGQAYRLLVQDTEIDVNQFDRIVANGGVSEKPEEASRALRLRLGNRLLGPGRFGKMFPNLEPFRPESDEALIELGQAMTSASPEDPALNNSDIP